MGFQPIKKAQPLGWAFLLFALGFEAWVWLCVLASESSQTFTAFGHVSWMNGTGNKNIFLNSLTDPLALL
jgi:hypothetical protein